MQRKRNRDGLMRGILGLLLASVLAACSHVQTGDSRRHELSVVVVYADRNTINAEARKRGYRSQANGFYDPARNELWCPNDETADAFRTCGHELRHAVKGNFHAQPTR
jgi:hypothetical protein